MNLVEDSHEDEVENVMNVVVHPKKVRPNRSHTSLAAVSIRVAPHYQNNRPFIGIWGLDRIGPN